MGLPTKVQILPAAPHNNVGWVRLMAKWKITWWFQDAIDGISRGSDVEDAPDDFTEEDAEEMLSAEMWENLDDSSKVKLENFAENANSPCSMKWGVLKIKRLK